VWRYFTDEGKATCKIGEQAVSRGGQKKARHSTKRSRLSHSY